MRHPSRSSSSASTVAHRQRQGCTASSSGAAASSAAADQHPSCPATWIVGLALLFAATTTDRIGARQLAGRFLPEYDFENANHHFQEPRCSFYGQDESMTGNESNDRTFGWFTSSSSSPSSGGAKEGTPDADKLVSGAKCSSGGQQSSDSETSSDQWRPDSGSSDAAATASVVGERRSRRTASSSKRRRSRSRRRSTQTPSRSSDPTSSASEEVLSTGRKAGSSGSATPSNTSFLSATIAATTIAVASAAALCAGSVAHVLKTVTAPSPTARFVPLPATFVESSPPEAVDRSTIQWSCQVCCSPFLQSGTRSCCNECHAPFEKAALRLFVGQLRKDCTAEYARWLFATFAPHISILHVEAHTTKGEQRTRGAGFVHVASKRDAEELCELLNKRIFADVVIEPETKTRVEGVWFVDRDDVQALVQYAQTRTAAKDRPFVLPRQPCVVEQRGHPDENAKSFRDAFRPRRFGEQPLRSEGKEGLDATTSKAAQQQRRQRRDVSAASSPLPVASAPRKHLPYCHDPYNWNPFVAQQQHQLPLAFPQYSYHGDYESNAAW